MRRGLGRGHGPGQLSVVRSVPTVIFPGMKKCKKKNWKILVFDHLETSKTNFPENSISDFYYMRSKKKTAKNRSERLEKV